MGFYFRRIERFHAERVPAAGPVLFASNHPNSLTDPFVIGASVPRKVNFMATVQLKEVKTGVARMALELEHRHGGRLGLQVMPAGLTYSAKEIYRSDVLVNFGEPLRAADYLEGYAERRKGSALEGTIDIWTTWLDTLL